MPRCHAEQEQQCRSLQHGSAGPEESRALLCVSLGLSTASPYMDMLILLRHFCLEAYGCGPGHRSAGQAVSVKQRARAS